MATSVDAAGKLAFLSDDLYDALRWLFEGAVIWAAAKEKERRGEEVCRHQALLGMYTSLVQARALYDFFYYKSTNRAHSDDAGACDFAKSWCAEPSKDSLYTKYMKRGKPANKRVFHLVYCRERRGGEPQLNTQVVEFARDLRALTIKFADEAEPQFQSCIHCALGRALAEAEGAAKHYGIANPFHDVGPGTRAP